MARAANKTVRFTQVVERSGRPRVHTLWLPPDEDPEFKRARHAHRVMTVEQSPGGGKADFGRVGFDEKHEHGGQFLIFPKSLKSFEGARVVGLKFDLVEQPKLASSRRPKRLSPPPKRAKSRAQPPSTPSPGERMPSLAKRAATAPRHPQPSRADPDATLRDEVGAALKELEHGKYVIAYQRLERALSARRL